MRAAALTVGLLLALPAYGADPIALKPGQSFIAPVSGELDDVGNVGVFTDIPTSRDIVLRSRELHAQVTDLSAELTKCKAQSPEPSGSISASTVVVVAVALVTGVAIGYGLGHASK